MSSTPPGFYHPFDKNDFRYDRCFLCGNDIATNISMEHVFPKWLLHEYNLFNETLTLLNGTQIPYRSLLIPCCKTCNTGPLSQMEVAFNELWQRGFANLSADDEMTIFQWTAKLIYGTLYKELSLDIDRRDPEKGKIITPELIDNYQTLHLFMQSIRVKAEFRQPVPWSVFAFRYKDDSFNYFNDITQLCLSIKLGQYGITIAFEDNNFVAKTLTRLQALYQYELSSEMFWEVSARVFYQARLITKTPMYVTAHHQATNTLQIISRELPAREHNDEEFAAFFGAILQNAGITLDRPMYENGQVATILFDQYNGAYIDNIIAQERKKSNKGVSG